MAEILSTLSSDGLAGTPTNGGDRYVSMIAWTADQQQNLITGGNTGILEGYRGTTVENGWDADGVLVETGRVFLNGWDCDEANPLIIRAASGQENLGSFSDGFTIKLPGTADVIACDDAGVSDLTFQGFHIISDLNNGTYFRYQDNLRFRRMIFSGGKAVNKAGIYTRAAGTTLLEISDCIFSATASASCVLMRGAEVYKIRNSLLKSERYAVQYLSSGTYTADIKNSAFYASTSWMFNNTAYSGTLDSCAFNASSITEPATNSQFNLSISDAVDFVSPSTDNYNPAATGILRSNAANLTPLYTTDIALYERPAAGFWDIGPLQTQGTPTGPTFEGPDIVAQTGIKDSSFTFNQAGGGTVADRFTGASSFAYASGSNQPAGITINPTTGNPEGVPTEAGTFSITIEGSD